MLERCSIGCRNSCSGQELSHIRIQNVFWSLHRNRCDDVSFKLREITSSVDFMCNCSVKFHCIEFDKLLRILRSMPASVYWWNDYISLKSTLMTHYHFFHDSFNASTLKFPGSPLQKSKK